ncbi:MAG: hypothetical protein JWR00_2653, partial [Rubritepida sp.]|nr:hypothetical protein [Rubritepida sp.]
HDHRPLDKISRLAGPCWSYRGSEIHGNARLSLFNLEQPPPGLPGGWHGIGSKEHLMEVVDCWLDRGTLPQGYRVPLLP